jgi:hypothetical protein
MSNVFNDARKCSEFLAKELNLEAQTDPTIKSALDVALKKLVESCEVAPNKPARGFALQFGTWAVRDEDLKFFETIKETVVALAAAKFTTPLDVAAIVAISFALANLIRNAYLSGARITNEQRLILACLRHSGSPVSPHYISGFLGKSWTVEKIQHELTALTKVTTIKGPVSFVQCTANGQWCLAGV